MAEDLNAAAADSGGVQESEEGPSLEDGKQANAETEEIEEKIISRKKSEKSRSLF